MSNSIACSACGIIKLHTSEHFVIHKQCRNGLTKTCRTCSRLKFKKWKLENRDHVLIEKRKFYKFRYKDKQKEILMKRTIREPYKIRAQRMIASMNTSRRKHNTFIAEDVTTEYLEELMKSQSKCACCGVTFMFSPSSTGYAENASCSVDKFRPSLGYTKNNITLICWKCNNIKRNYTEDELEMVAAWMRKRSNETDKFRTPPESVYMAMLRDLLALEYVE